jgi:hypothetical protein
MNQNSNLDNFIFNFPTDFVPDELEERYKVHLKNFHKPYDTVLDYMNSQILDITVPAMTFPTVDQKKWNGKEKVYRGALSPYDVYNRDFNVTMKSVDFNIPYFIMQDIMLYHYMKNGKSYLEPFNITILDEERREHFKIILSELVPVGLSDTRLAYNIKNVDLQTYTVSFKYNFTDIEYIPKLTDGSVEGELIENYSDIIIPNDDRINLENTSGSTEYIIGQ